MSQRSRLARLTTTLEAQSEADRCWLAVVVPVDRDSAGRPPGVYAVGSLLEVVHDGSEPPSLPANRLAAEARVIVGVDPAAV